MGALDRMREAAEKEKARTPEVSAASGTTTGALDRMRQAAEEEKTTQPAVSQVEQAQNARYQAEQAAAQRARAGVTQATPGTGGGLSRSDAQLAGMRGGETVDTGKSTWDAIVDFMRRGRDTLFGTAKQSAGRTANLAGVVSDVQGGTAMSPIYHSQVQTLDDQIAALEKTLLDPTMTPRDIAETNDALRIAKQQRDIYGNAVRANGETAGQVYRLADDLARSGAQDIANAKEGLGKGGQFAVDAAALLGNVGAQTLENALVPGLGTFARIADVAGGATQNYRLNAGENYDPYNAGALGFTSAGGVALGSALSRAIGTAGINKLYDTGNITNLGAHAGVGALSGLGFAVGEIPLSEIGMHIADPTYTTDAKDVLKRAASAAAFGAVTQFLNGLRIRAQNSYTVSEPERELKWFRKDMTEDEAKKLWKQLSRQYHPDRGGDTATMQEINAEYEYFINSVVNRAQSAHSAAANAKARGDEATYQAASEEYRQAIGFLQEAVNDGIITGEAADAVSVLATIGNEGIAPSENESLIPASATSAVTNTATPPVETPAVTPVAPEIAPEAQQAPALQEPVPQEVTPREPTPQDIAPEAPIINQPQEEVAPRSKLPYEVVVEKIPSEELNARGADMVRTYAEKTLGENGAKTLPEFYTGGDSSEYIKGMTSYYNAGKDGRAFDDVTTEAALTDVQARAAYLAGQGDANIAKRTGAEQDEINEAKLPEQNTLQNAPKQGTMTAEETLKNALTAEGKYQTGNFEFKVFPIGNGYYTGTIRNTRNDVMGGMITDGNARLFRWNFKSLDNAVNGLAAVARSNKLLGEAQTGETQIADRYHDVKSQLDNDGNPVYVTSREQANIQPEDLSAQLKRQRAADAKFGLTDEEALKAKNYVKSTAYIINKKVYEGTLSEADKEYISKVAAAFEKFPIFEGRTYRNLSFKSKEQFDAFLSKYSSGANVTVDGFMSTSKLPNGYPLFGDYVVHMIIDGNNGRDIADTYGILRQQEVLYLPGTVVHVSSVGTANDGNPLISVKEIAANGQGENFGNRRSSGGNEGDFASVGANDAPRDRGLDDGLSEAAQRGGLRNGILPGRAAGGARSVLPVDEGVTPQQQIANDVRRSIEKGIAFNSARLFEIADKAYGGTMAEGKYTVKDAYDGMELAVNQYLMNNRAIRETANGSVYDAARTLTQLQTLLEKLPTQTKRTAEQDSYQQFSTPPTIAYLAAWAAHIKQADVVLEPSAGIGGLALWPKAWGATVYGNELSKRRLAFLDKLGLDGTFNLNAEQINNLLPDEIKPTVVLMNPPFSATAGRTATNKTANAKRHIEQALDRLENGGRLVAILGNGMSNDASAFRSWWNDLRKEYDIRANIRIDGENYKKYGTTFDIQLAIIDKTGPQAGETITGEYKDLSKIPTVLEGIRNDRTALEAAPRAERNAAVTGVPETSPRSVGAEPASDTGVAAGAGRESTGLGQPHAAAGAGSMENNAGHAGRVKPASTEGNVPAADGKRKPGAGGNGRRGAAVATETGEVAGGQAGAASGRSSGKSGIQRIESKGDLSSNQLTKEAAEHPDSVYSTYVPRKARVKGAKPHPAKLVESAAMAAVEPPDVTYTPNLPADIVTKGVLSDAQLENVIYAGQAHAQTLTNGERKGFFIGDGTGVGKGRQIAGIIMDNFRQGRSRAIWISEKSALINDAQRDWKALGGNEADVIDLKKIKYKTGGKIDAASGIVFSSYDTLKTDKDARIRLLQDWLGKDFDGVIALDEAHNMGNANGKKGARGATKPSQKALAGIDLQKAFPNARIVYASATGATEASNYAYLQRLGLWGKGTAFNDFNDFMSKISNGGLAAMELVARDMKAMGEYMARSISYDDVKYDTLQHDLTPMQTEIYNTMSRAWQKVLQNVNEALKITGQESNGNARGRAMSQIFGTQQRFYNQILTSMSMPSVIEDMRKELSAGRSCVLQLVNTNAAAADRAIAKNAEAGGDLDDLDLTPSDMLIQMVQNAFPVELYEEYTDDEGRTRSRPVLDGEGKPVIDKKAVKLRDALIADLKMMKVPDGPLEMLFDAFGEENVAEVTGRTRRVVDKLDENGNRKRVIERRSNNSGIADANMFQDGKKRILVFSDAGGTGRSYHADLTAKNQQQRVHYLLQPGWEASKAVQGFGRTHRSNQASAPIFRLITTNVMGQKRFTSTIARRLDQLGALTKGQRQAGSGVFGEKDNLENPIAMDALSQYYKTVSPDMLKKLGLYDKIYDEFGRFNDKSETLRDIGKFLNRILSLEVDEQNEVFQGFYDTFDRFMDQAIQNGTVDMGLENYRADKIDVVDEKVVRKDPTGADTKYVQMTAYRKPEITPYSKVKDAHPKYQGIVRMEDGSARAVYEISSKTNPKTGEIQRRFKLESPVKGKSSTFVEETLKSQTKPVPKEEWKDAWNEEIEKVPEYDTSTLHLLTGTLLPIWDRLPQDNTRVMRVLSSDGKQYLGRVIRPDQIDGVLRNLGANRTVKQYTPEEVSTNVLQGKEAVFRDNRMRLNRRRVSGEWRLELTGQNLWYLPRQYSGIITERINFDTRYFIPTGENGNRILGEIMKNNPVVDLHNAATEPVEQMRSKESTPDHSEQWTAQRVGSSDKTPMRLSEIIDKIRHDFGINITTGHIRGSGVRGQYNHGNRGIRTKIANDLPTAAHELGHHLDNTYGLVSGAPADAIRELVDNLDPEFAAQYKEKKLPGEGMAEYLRRFLQNSETAEIDYPKFTQYFKSTLSGQDLALIEELADEVNAYYSLDADTATSSVRLKEEARKDQRTLGEKIKDVNADWYQHWVDRNHGIKRFAEDMGDRNSYMLATISAYSDAMSGALLTGDLYDAQGKYIGPGLRTALHGINLKDKNEYRKFGEYLIVKHGPERLAEGMRIFADDRKNSTAWMNHRQAELEQQYPAFREASERLYQFRHDLYEAWGVDTGLISQATLDAWEERWDFYMPLNRAVDIYAGRTGAKRGFANQNSTIKRAHGSGLDVVHPVDNLIDNMILLVNAGMRNSVMRSLTDAALDNDGDAIYMEKVPTPLKKTFFDATGIKAQLGNAVEESGLDETAKQEMQEAIAGISDILEQYGRGKAHGNVVTVLKNGKPEFWKINDPLLLESLVSFDAARRNKAVEAYKAVSRFMTACITGNDVLWSIFSNFPRDLQTLMTYSPDKKHPLSLIKNIGEAYVNRFRSDYDKLDPFYKEYLAMGGGQTSVYTADKNVAARAREKLSGSKMRYLNPLEWLGFISETVETGPRYAVYKLCRQRGMSPQEAIYASHDVTVNFRRGGTTARDVNGFVLYFNAAIQGADKFNRYFAAEDVPHEQRAKTATGRIAAYVASQIILGTLMYALNNRTDDDKENYQQLSNYTKNSYWLFPLGDGTYFAIPKARELSVLASLSETLAEYFYGGNKRAFEGFWSYATDNYAPPVVSDILSAPEDGENAMWGAIASAGIAGVLTSTAANRDYLGRPIESAGMQYLEPKDRYNQRTSRLARLLTDGLRELSGGAVNLSPQKADYFFQQTLGGFWKAQKALFPVGSENIDLTLGIMNRFIKDNQYSTDLTNWLYDKKEASAQAAKSDPTNMDKKITAAMDDRMTDFYSSYYKLAKNNTEAERGTRQVVLNMIKEYQKNDDLNSMSRAQQLVYSAVKADGKTDLLPSTVNVQVKDGNGVQHTLSDVQYVEYQTDYNRLYWQYAERTLPLAKTDKERIVMLRSAKEYAASEALDRTLGRIMAPKTNKYQYDGISSVDTIRFRAATSKDMADTDKSGTVNQQEFIDAIESLGLMWDQNSTLFHTKYDSDKNNPWK